MKEDVAEMIREILKVDPKEGDVIAVKVPKHWDRVELWEVINEIREKGIQIVAFTEDVTLSVIKDHHSYFLQIPQALPRDAEERIKREWTQYFPKAPIMVVSGPTVLAETSNPLLQPDPSVPEILMGAEDDVDTL